jgi:hypothetical protein
MDPRWQPPLGPVQTAATPEACDLLAAGWEAQNGECRIESAVSDVDPRLVSPETWRSLRDRHGFLRAPLRMQQRRD